MPCDGWCRGRFAVPWVMASAGCLLVFIGSRIPCPLGRGNMYGLRVLSPSAVRGSGVSSRFSLSRGSSSCHLVVIVSLLASSSCSRRPRLSALPASVPSPSPPRCVLVWLLIASLPVPSTSCAGRSLLTCFIRFRLSLSRPVLPLCCLSRLVPRACLPSVDRS